MSYVIWQGEPINMSKGTISMWFRVPKESVDAIEWEQPEGFLNPFLNAIPILVFSSQPYGPWTEFSQPVINTFYKNLAPPGSPPNFQPVPYLGSVPLDPWQLPYNPCMIAVYVPSKESNAKPTLGVILQTMDVGVPSNTNHAVVKADGVVVDGRLLGPTKLYFENASAADAKMDWFDASPFGPEVEVDVWHHILLSWDLQKTNSADGNAIDPNNPPPNKPFSEFFTAKSIMYCAFDDEDLTGNDLPTAYWTDGFMPNEIACYSCWHLAGASYFTVPPNPVLNPPYYGFPTYNVTFEKGIQMDTVAVPSDIAYQRWTGDATSPATEEVREVNKKIEVAELQIFSDLLLETYIEDNRRAFIDYKRDADGNPVEDDEGNRTLMPVKPKVAEDLFGRPVILLHGSKNWKVGKNTGSSGFDIIEGSGSPIEQEIPEGQFTPVGGIERYKPDPSIAETPEP